MTLANTWLTAASTLTSSGYNAQRLHSDTYQDFVVFAPVPEPSSYALILAGMGAIGFVARRRKAQA